MDRRTFFGFLAAIPFAAYIPTRAWGKETTLLDHLEGETVRVIESIEKPPLGTVFYVADYVRDLTEKTRDDAAVCAMLAFRRTEHHRGIKFGGFKTRVRRAHWTRDYGACSQGYNWMIIVKAEVAGYA